MELGGKHGFTEKFRELSIVIDNIRLILIIVIGQVGVISFGDYLLDLVIDLHTGFGLKFVVEKC